MASFFSRREGASASQGAEPAVRVGHLYLDTRRRRLYCLNEAARQLHREGLPMTATGEAGPALQTLEGEAVPAADLPLVRAWREGEPQEASFLLPRAGGLLHHVTWTATPLRGEQGELTAVLGTVTVAPPEPDWQVLAGLAHDLRTPLQTLQLLLPLLDGIELGQAEWQEVLGRLRSASERALSIGLDVVEWCRGPVQSGRRVQPAWFPLEPFLGALAAEHAVTAGRKSLELVSRLDATRDWEVYSDRVRLGRLLSNLLSNAIRYTAVGRVAFTAAWRQAAGDKDGPALVLSVADTGRGISKEEQESIFTAYERGTAGTEGGEPSSGGSGLGLSVVDRLVDELGLSLEVSSEYGRGSRFDLLLPPAVLRRMPG
jgi:signal transduction histidine kinase